MTNRKLKRGTIYALYGLGICFLFGDAVIIEKINNETKLKKGDIIAYSSGKLVIVHRITEIEGTGENTMYTTKGDANNTADPRTVKRNQIKGIIKVDIPFIAWPTVWLSELFNS